MWNVEVLQLPEANRIKVSGNCFWCQCVRLIIESTEIALIDVASSEKPMLIAAVSTRDCTFAWKRLGYSSRPHLQGDSVNLTRMDGSCVCLFMGNGRHS